MLCKPAEAASSMAFRSSILENLTRSIAIEWKLWRGNEFGLRLENEGVIRGVDMVYKTNGKRVQSQRDDPTVEICLQYFYQKFAWHMMMT